MSKEKWETCCLRWTSCCFISSHILWDSTASFSSWGDERKGTTTLHFLKKTTEPNTMLVFCTCMSACSVYNYKFFLSVVALLWLLQQLLSLVKLCVHQLLLQVLVLYHFVYVLVGVQRNKTPFRHAVKNLVNWHDCDIRKEKTCPRTSSRSLYCS